MNVMHSSMDITDETYSRLDEQDIKARIGQLGQLKGEAKKKVMIFLIYSKSF